MKKSLFFFIMIAISMASCQSVPAKTDESVTLKIAVLPVLDALPMYVADQEGFFAAHGVQVEFVAVGSGPERDQLITAGQADGMINEVLSTLFYNKDATQVQIVRYARAATPNSALFRILASAKSGITSLDELKGAEIGVSDGTIIAYLTDRLLQEEGLQPDDIQTVSIPKIDLRMSLLGSGEIQAAMLPDPLSSLAIQQGAVVVLDDTRHPELSFSTIAFRKTVIDQHPEAIRGFLAAIEDATQSINQDPERYTSLLKDRQLVPVSLLDQYKLPKFVTADVPTEAQFNDVVEWAKGRGLLKGDVSYANSVNASFLPQ